MAVIPPGQLAAFLSPACSDRQSPSANVRFRPALHRRAADVFCDVLLLHQKGQGAEAACGGRPGPPGTHMEKCRVPMECISPFFLVAQSHIFNFNNTHSAYTLR